MISPGLIKKISFIWLTFFIIVLSACESATQAGGQVKDTNGREIENVSVMMETNGNTSNGELKKKDEQMTKPDGTYNFVAITGSATQIRLTFAKEGYKTRQVEITANKENVADVILESDTK
jgi:Carboxypeptidase regulatory-like domain